MMRWGRGYSLDSFSEQLKLLHLAKNKRKQNNNNYREKRFPENPLRRRAGRGSGAGPQRCAKEGHDHPHGRAWGAQGGVGGGLGTPFSQSRSALLGDAAALSFPRTKLNNEQKGTADS